MQPEISCERVRKIYGQGARAFEAVNAATFSVEKGEFVSLLGPSGCGKSTLLMMIAGLESVTDGRVLAGGTPVDEPRAEIGIVFQDPTLLPWKTALQNILFPIEMMHRSRAAHVDRAIELLRLVGLVEAANKRPGQLSGGMKQRVSLCRALIADPAILLMDEPFSALDAITRDDMNIVLLALWERYRKTVLFVTHSIREAALLSDRVLVMGGTPSTIIADIKVPFARPRHFTIGETAEFNALCSALRDEITKARGTQIPQDSDHG
jgi:NitT/TauT family transport system ATP-binding protein